ncbi:hypothetical protein EMIHUDRAFT_431730 [Emiliania huxleyi CCMP1516]|uniref:Uncharacterized protein n=2 Tax=Emiliania huxleyi TaxID=2903 RepID=A0A0D3L0T6_EMIH1|nr:hypothetical protein EMIHUDRAFT_431730 [Emiliania huxleyi CCMP1516]EOD41621.1 hypothetical protein EMIHUDRAFT_431730 [Emiliania huxleyi CCMP1516]|eukprot:XP_005794050.1 hypothetical protein EMIHUDRAFT_431730 [Emiliania huxleyi CCMP1516]
MVTTPEEWQDWERENCSGMRRGDVKEKRASFDAVQAAVYGLVCVHVRENKLETYWRDFMTELEAAMEEAGNEETYDDLIDDDIKEYHELYLSSLAKAYDKKKKAEQKVNSDSFALALCRAAIWLPKSFLYLSVNIFGGWASLTLGGVLGHVVMGALGLFFLAQAFIPALVIVFFKAVWDHSFGSGDDSDGGGSGSGGEDESEEEDEDEEDEEEDDDDDDKDEEDEEGEEDDSD